jgi:hypothetical protein
MATYYASVPAGSDLHFPRVCPFTGRPDPKGRVRLAKTAAAASSDFGLLEVCLLLFGLHFGRTSTSSVRVPADRRFAWKAGLVEFAMWICFLAALVSVAVVFAQVKLSLAGRVPAFCLGGTILATIFLKVWHYLLLRPVTLGEGSDCFLEIGFLSENYALEFASLNKVFLDPR